MINKAIDAEIKNITSQIVKKYKPQKIILYGSATHGKFNPEKSDLDFLVIKEDKRDLHDRIVTLYRLIKKNYRLIFLFTPQRIRE